MSENEIVQEAVKQASEILKDPKVIEEAKKTVKKKHKPQAPFKVGESGFLTKAQREHVILVEDEADMLYNPKVKDPPPEKLHEALADENIGWLETNPLTILPDGRIWSGRTKWRVLAKAEKLRGGEIKVPYLVIDIDEERASDATDMLDLQVQKLNPMLVAEKIVRALSRGKTEKEIFELTGIKSEDQHGYLLLVEKLPENMQDLVRQGLLPMAAAVEIARSADKLSEGEMRSMAEQVAKMANGGIKVTAAQVKKAAGVSEDGPATQKQRKQAILDLQSGELRGKQGEAVKWAAIVALEVGLGTRTIDSAWAAWGKLAQGQTIRVDFKQYVGDANVGKGMEGGTHESKPVKGQEKVSKKHKK